MDQEPLVQNRIPYQHRRRDESVLHGLRHVASSSAARCPTCATGSSPPTGACSTACADGAAARTAPYRKCAKIVGEVMGNYHPHGDAGDLRHPRPAWRRTSTCAIPSWTARGTSARSTATRRGHALHRGPPQAARRRDDGATSTRRRSTSIPNYDDSPRSRPSCPTPFPNLLVNGSAGHRRRAWRPTSRRTTSARWWTR